MGQYHLTVNLDKREFLDPHKLGDGLKLSEQASSACGTAAALMVLLACSGYNRGGGDVCPVQRVQIEPGVWALRPVDDPELEARMRAYVGRWAGDRIAVVGDYAEDTDLPAEFEASKIYQACRNGEYRDISDEVLPILEHWLGIRVERTDGWRERYDPAQDPQAHLDEAIRKTVRAAAEVLGLSVQDTYRFLLVASLEALDRALTTMLLVLPRP